MRFLLAASLEALLILSESEKKSERLPERLSTSISPALALLHNMHTL
jgi:hypothetical protein